jgi:hypothetical protein
MKALSHRRWRVYTLEDYERARAELQEWDDKFDSYSGNNPDKYRSEINMAASKVRAIESYLKKSGLLPMSEREKLELELDAMFPKAKSKEIVLYQGRRYQRRFFPLAKSRSGKTVTEWGKAWVEVS